MRGGWPLPPVGGPCGGPCGAWATVATAKTAAVNNAIAAAGGDREVIFKLIFLAGWDGRYPMDEILTKKDAPAY